MSKVQQLEDAIRAHVLPGMHLHFPSTPSRSNVSIIALARCFRGQKPRFVLSCSGFHSTAHLLPLLDLGKRYAACFFGDNYPVPRPNELYTALAARPDVELQFWSLLSYIAAFRAGANNVAYEVVRSLVGSTLGADLARAGMFLEIPDPANAREKIGLVKPVRPDVVFIHGLMGDDAGNAVFGPPYSEGFWSACGATRGAIVTVEKIADRAALREHRDAMPIPADRVLAICEEPMGAHPQPLYVAPRFGVDGYPDDFAHYLAWRNLTTSKEKLAELTARVLEAPDRRSAYLSYVEDERQTMPVPASDDNIEHHERMVGLAARTITKVMKRKGYRSILAGIGRGYLASRMAKLLLAREGVAIQVLVETGLIDVECGTEGDNFLLSHTNMLRAGRLTSAEHVLGMMTCGAENRCLGVLGAAEIDRTGAINTTRLASGKVLLGSGGANDIASGADEVLVITSCDRHRLVDQVAHVTSPGTRVSRIITDLCTLERAGPDRWRVGEVYPSQRGASIDGTLDLIKERCPWDLEIPAEVSVSSGLSTAELRWIHTLDPTGDLWAPESK